MKRRILSVAIAILILTVSVIPGLSALAAGTVPTLSGGVYQIGTASELIWFADAVNSGSQSIKGKLTADIQLKSLRAGHKNKNGAMLNCTAPYYFISILPQ